MPARRGMTLRRAAVMVGGVLLAVWIRSGIGVVDGPVRGIRAVRGFEGARGLGLFVAGGTRGDRGAAERLVRIEVAPDGDVTSETLAFARGEGFRAESGNLFRGADDFYVLRMADGDAMRSSLVRIGDGRLEAVAMDEAEAMLSMLPRRPFDPAVARELSALRGWMPVVELDDPGRGDFPVQASRSRMIVDLVEEGERQSLVVRSGGVEHSWRKAVLRVDRRTSAADGPR